MSYTALTVLGLAPLPLIYISSFWCRSIAAKKIARWSSTIFMILFAIRAYFEASCSGDIFKGLLSCPTQWHNIAAFLLSLPLLLGNLGYVTVGPFILAVVAILEFRARR